jgi:hypothetical protein
VFTALKDREDAGRLRFLAQLASSEAVRSARTSWAAPSPWLAGGDGRNARTRICSPTSS